VVFVVWGFHAADEAQIARAIVAMKPLAHAVRIDRWPTQVFFRLEWGKPLQ